jgi:phosphoribosyl 1,2-cyclic phosphodiesterase
MRPAIRVRLWGVRGSVPAPGAATRRHGGNTSCISVRAPDGGLLVLDAGTGLRALGDDLLRGKPPNDGAGPLDVALLLTHVHWDHVQGLPFFAPIYDPRLRLTVYTPTALEPAVRSVMHRQMCPPSFPVRLDETRSTIAFQSVPDGGLRVHTLTIRPIVAHHPGGAFGWRLADADGAPLLAFLPDNEIDDTTAPHGLRPHWLDALRGVKLLLHDATYLPSDAPRHRGWGHSSWDEVVRLAVEAEVERLVLFHHHPDRSDAAVDRIVDEARAMVASLGSPLRLLAGSEGLILHV